MSLKEDTPYPNRIATERKILQHKLRMFNKRGVEHVYLSSFGQLSRKRARRWIRKVLRVKGIKIATPTGGFTLKYSVPQLIIAWEVYVENLHRKKTRRQKRRKSNCKTFVVSCRARIRRSGDVQVVPDSWYPHGHITQTN